MKHYPPYRDPNHSTLAHVFGWLLLALVLLVLAAAVDGQEPARPQATETEARP